MKVCIVSPGLTSFYGVTGRAHFGGAEVQAAFVADALRAAGADVTLVVADLPAGASLPFPGENAFFAADGVRGLRFFHPRWSGITAALARADADVYYQRNAGMITGVIAMFCRKHGRRFVYGAGSDVDFLPRDVSIPGLRDRLLFRYGLARCAGIVVQNRKQLAAARVLAKPVRLIPNGIRPVAAVDGGARRVIVWIGSLWTLKRPDRLLELARRMPEREFIMVGGDFPSEPAYSARIRKEAKALLNVTITGRRPHEEVDAILGRAAVLVNTSEVEGFPNAYLEAWSSGVPVVTFNDVDDIIRANDMGRVVGSMEEMVETVRALGQDDARRAMGERAREHVRMNFSPAALGPRYVEFFADLRAT